MSSDISPANEQFIQDALADGAYETRGQLIDEALELLKRRADVRQKIQAGIDQLDRGEGIPAEEVWADLEEEVKAIERESQEQ